MSEEQYSGRRRSTRGQLSDTQGEPGGKSPVPKDRSKSRLADGVRSRSGSPDPSAPSDGNADPKSGKKQPETPGSKASKDAKDGSGPKENKEQGGKKGSDDGARRQGSNGSSKPQTANTGAKPSRKQPGAAGAEAGKEPKAPNDPNESKDQTGKKGDRDSGIDASDKKVGGVPDSPAKGPGKRKNMGADATGVDYSDKKMKDRLEHQAADTAMDATPGLAQFNSARKALKQFNKAKKDAGGKGDGLTDQVEEKMDDGVDKGIKGVKIAAGINLGGSAVGLGMAGMLLMKGLMAIKALALGILGKMAGFLGSIFSAISSFFSGSLGLTTAIGNIMAVGIMSTFVGVGGLVVVGLGQEITKKDDSTFCTPEQTKVSKASQEYIFDGEIEAVRRENAVKLWSVYSELGGSKEQTAAVLGNLQAESSLDPTAVETIYDEPFAIGAGKQSAIAADFKVELIDASYAARFPAINYVGIGLAQWTNGRNRLLIEFANEQGVNWFDFDTQVRFMLAGDDAVRQRQLTDFLGAEPGNVQRETERFMNTWIGLSSPNHSLLNRQTNATDYMFILERATADRNYANSILSGLNVDRSGGNSAAGAYHQDDGCGNPIKSHYGNQAADGTGEVPSDLTLVPWSRETLPESLKEFYKNPEDAGLAWGNASGWTNGIIPDQCAALSHSYFIRLYPGWDQEGRAGTRPFGDGKDVASKWADHYGESIGAVPSSGAVFSDSTTSEFGHTGIVQHVFANGDILIVEQNIRGVSGAGAGLNYSWSWRVIKKDRYEQEGWDFFKPTGAQPQWATTQI
ncbi:phage tail tip lysozyme [Metabacillus sp. SLBN-84]